MSGPGLAKRDAHHAIHEAAFGEAEELTRVLRQVALAADHERALQLVGLLVEHWQARTLRHAAAEEQGWYREVARERPELQPDIMQLTRDHDLLRTLLGEIEQIVATRGWATGIVERFEAMLLLNAIHSRDEEQRLLGGEAPTRAGGEAEIALNSARPPDARGPQHPPDAPTNRADDNTAPETADLPLAVAYPRLYRLAIERLGERGIQPGDLRLGVRRGSGDDDGDDDDMHNAEARLVAAFGPGFSQTLEVPLPAVSNHVAAERTLDAIANACERAVRGEYFAAMQIAEPGAPGSHGNRSDGGKRARFSLTVLDPPKG